MKIIPQYYCKPFNTIPSIFNHYYTHIPDKHCFKKISNSKFNLYQTNEIELKNRREYLNQRSVYRKYSTLIRFLPKHSTGKDDINMYQCVILKIA